MNIKAVYFSKLFVKWYLFFLFSLVSLNIGYCDEATSKNQAQAYTKSPKEIKYCSPKTFFVVVKTIEEVFLNRASIKKLCFSLNENDDEGEVKITAITEPITSKTIFHNGHPPRQIDIILKTLQEMDFVKDLKIIEAKKIKFVFEDELRFSGGWEFEINFKIVVNK